MEVGEAESALKARAGEAERRLDRGRRAVEAQHDKSLADSQFLLNRGHPPGPTEAPLLRNQLQLPGQNQRPGSRGPAQHPQGLFQLISDLEEEDADQFDIYQAPGLKELQRERDDARALADDMSSLKADISASIRRMRLDGNKEI